MIKGRIKYVIMLLSCYLLIALLAPIIATDLPLYAKYNNRHLFPAFVSEGKLPEILTGKIMPYSMINWKKLQLESVIWAPIPYAPQKSDHENYHYASPLGNQFTLTATGEKIAMPLRFRHWLGTGKRGEDILSGMIHGGRMSLIVALLATLITGLLGISLGILSGYFGNTKLKAHRVVLISTLLGIYLSLFYGIYVRRYSLSSISDWVLSVLLAIGIMLLMIQIGKFLSRKSSAFISIPLDSWISRIIELFTLAPKLLLILVIASLTGPSVSMLIIVIGLTSWTNIARITRAGFMRITTESYIEWAQAAGYAHWRIILKHILPNIMAPLGVTLIFTITASIFIESSLSFIGMGLPPDIVSIGSIINDSRENLSAYWMIIPPSLFIMGLILSLNALAEWLALKYKTKSIE